MKKLSNTEAELKKSVAYKKKRVPYRYRVLHIPEVLFIFIISLFKYLFHMHSKLLTFKLWSGF